MSKNLGFIFCLIFGFYTNAQTTEIQDNQIHATIIIGKEFKELGDSVTTNYTLSQFKKRKIKSELEETYLAKIKGDSIIKLYRHDLAYMDFDKYIEYDTLNRIVKKIRYNNGVPFLNEYYKTDFDEEGNAKDFSCSIETNKCEQNGRSIYKNGNLLEFHRLEKGEIKAKSIYQYNQNNQLTKISSFSVENGKEQRDQESQSFFEYDYKGNLVLYRHKYGNDWADSIDKFEYDDSGNVIREVEGNVYPEFKDSSVQLTRTNRYLFDEYGNWTTKFINVNNGTLYFVVERIIEYY